VISNLDATTVWEALAQLSEEHRRIVELRLAGLTDREIAAALGKSHGAIRMSQMRAVRRLRALLLPPDETERVRR
jgi:RNA polymerase sigma factor (sigma-70 family)